MRNKVLKEFKIVIFKKVLKRRGCCDIILAGKGEDTVKNAVYENKSDPIQLRIDKTLSPFPHLHKEIEIVYVIKGSTIAYADRICTKIGPGDLFVSFPNQMHYYEESQIGEYYLLIISPDLFFGLKNLFNENIPKNNVLHIGSNSQASRLLESSFKELDRQYGKTIAVGLINQAIGQVFEQFVLKPRIKTDNSTLQSILNYCNLNFTADITLDDAAESLHLSRYHISHLFNNKLGIGFNTYINTLRINKACDLLEETDKKTTDISTETGFGSIRSFNRAFLQIMDMSPLQYRKLVKTTDKDLPKK